MGAVRAMRVSADPIHDDNMFHFCSSGRRSKWNIALGLFVGFALFLTAVFLYRGRPSPLPVQVAFPLQITSTSHSLLPTNLVKPDNVRVIALVFFGRRNRVEMLRCYIERNLVQNGGWLDEVHWVQNTGKPEDLEYLDEILASEDNYKRVTLKGVGFEGYKHAWDHLERGNLYVKIDDDVVGSQNGRVE